MAPGGIIRHRSSALDSGGDNGAASEVGCPGNLGTLAGDYGGRVDTQKSPQPSRGFGRSRIRSGGGIGLRRILPDRQSIDSLLASRYLARDTAYPEPAEHPIHPSLCIHSEAVWSATYLEPAVLGGRSRPFLVPSNSTGTACLEFVVCSRAKLTRIFPILSCGPPGQAP